MFYVGSHKGTINDGYIGSNKRLKNVYKKRPEDLKRRILFLCIENDHKVLKEKEQYYLNMIKEEELNKKYYNAKKAAIGFDSCTAKNLSNLKVLNGTHPWVKKGRIVSKETRKKISETLKGNVRSEETRRKISETHKLKYSEERRKKMSELYKGKKRSEEIKKKISESHKGKVCSDETKRKMSEAHKGKILSEKTKRKISEARKNVIYK